MTTIYIDPSAMTNGDGSLASPRNTWTGVPTGAGNVYKQKRGTTWTGSFPSLTSGTSGNVTTITSYANADGSDNASLPLPIIDIGNTIMPGGVNSPKTFTKWSNVDIRCARTTIASDTPIMWVGSDVEISDCVLSTNLTALYGEKCSRVQILRNTITCATAVTTTAAMDAIVLGGSLALDDNVIDGNTIYVGDGGKLGTHAIKVAAAVPITSIQITNNTIRTVSGQPTPHADKAGIFINNGAGASLFGPTSTVAASIIIAGNDVANLVDGVFLASVNGAWVHHNTLDHCGSFGLHITGNSTLPSSGCLIEWNMCRWAGRNLSPFYGRGIELSGAGQLDACTGHVVRFNDASYAKNWGGPVDNATEGVGIGLDDATSCCQVYGNLIRGTEGNGIQFYGGSAAPSDTGGNMVIGNHIIDCGLGSYKNRRTSPVLLGMPAIGLSKTAGSRTVIAYNTIIGGTGGIRPDSLCSGVELTGNVFKRQTVYAIAAASTDGISGNCYDPACPKQIGTLATNASGSPAPALLSAGVNGDKTADALVSESFVALVGSPLLDKAFRNGVPFAPLMLDLAT
jgi:hypothetical protein